MGFSAARKRYDACHTCHARRWLAHLAAARSIAYVAFEVVELAIWIVLLVYGYEHGGVTGSVVMSLVQLVPGAALAPGLAPSPTGLPPSGSCSAATASWR